MKNKSTPNKQSVRTANARPKVPRPPALAQKPLPTAAPHKEAPSYWQKYRWYVVGFFAAIVVFAGCTGLVYQQLFFGEDYRLFRFINNWPEKLSIVFVALTALGSFWTAAVVVTSAFVFKLYQLALRLSLSIFAVYGLLLVVKEIFARPRPELAISDVYVRVLETSFAFPSAHTAVATVLGLTLRTYLPLPPIWQWAVVLLWVGGVGVSRVYLGVHMPLDVAGGFVVGVGVVCFFRILPAPLKKILHLK